MTPIAFDRATMLGRLADETFDVLVVGGGITGAGVALDAASRGLRTALVETGDFASGTSSKSLQARPRRPALPPAARGRASSTRPWPSASGCASNAPHLVRVLPFLIPILDQGRRRAAEGGPGAGHRRCGCTTSPAGARIGKLHQRLTEDEALAHMPTLPAERLASAYLYYDARADDARLTPGRGAHGGRDHGAVVANYATLSRPAQGRRRAGDRRRAVEADGERVRRAPSRRRQRRRRVGRRGARPRRGRATPTASARPRGSTSPSRGRRCAPTSPPSSPCRRTGGQPLRRAVGRARLHRHHRHRLRRPARRPAVHARRHRLRAAGAQRLGDDRGHRARRARHLGRAAAAGQERGERPHRRPLPPAQGDARRPSGVVTVTGGKLTTYRRMAADTVDEVVGRCSSAGGRSRTEPRPAAAAPTASCEAAARRARRRPPRTAATAARRRTVEALIAGRARARPSRSCRASPTCGPRPSTRPATRWPSPSTTS